MIKVANNLLNLSQHMLKRSYDPAAYGNASMPPWRYPLQQPQLRYDSGGTGFHAEGKPAVSMIPEEFERYQARMLLNPRKMGNPMAFPDAETAAAYYNTALGGNTIKGPSGTQLSHEEMANYINNLPPDIFGDFYRMNPDNSINLNPWLGGNPATAEGRRWDEGRRRFLNGQLEGPFNPNEPYLGHRDPLGNPYLGRKAVMFNAAYRRTPENPEGNIFHYTEGPDGKPVFSNPEYLKSLAAEGNRMVRQRAEVSEIAMRDPALWGQLQSQFSQHDTPLDLLQLVPMARQRAEQQKATPRMSQ
jgi:hypothetical protein